MERELVRAMDIVVEHHRSIPACYYLGEGRDEGLTDCKLVLKLLHILSRQYAENFITDPNAIPLHDLFRIIRAHLDQIHKYYVSKETELYQELLKRLLPSNPNPLRHIVLSSMSLFTARVYLHAKDLSPDPIRAYVDGYFNLVIDLTENVVRIPLLPDSKTSTNVTLPPALRFKGINEADEERIKKYVFEECPEHGRKNQLSSFISVLNSNKPPSDYLTSFKNALASIDMSFSTALCSLTRDPHDNKCLISLFNVLGCDNALDLFIREISVASIPYIISAKTGESVDVVALTNFFIGLTGNWAAKVVPKGSISSLVRDVCKCISHSKISVEALYVLKSALVIAAYDDSKGIAPISMFLELTIRPFALTYGMSDQLDALKLSILNEDSSSSDVINQIEKTILNVMGSDIEVQLSPREIKGDLRNIHTFINSRLDDFIDFVIILNQRPKLEHPLMMMMMFSYQMAAKHGLIE